MKLPERFSSDMFLIFTSLLIACVIWLIAKGNDREQNTFAAALILENRPDNVQVHLTRELVNVTANFPKNLQPYMLSSNFQVVLDWNDIPEGAQWVGVEEFHKSPPVSLDPRESVRAVGGITQELRSRIERHVEFLSVSPGKTVVEAKYFTRPVNLSVATSGNVPSGYRQSGPIIPIRNPNLMLTASPARFRDLGAADETSSVLVSTDPIDLDNHRSSFTEAARLRIPPDTQIIFQEDDTWRIEDQRRVEVRVPIGEITDRQRTIGKVPIQIKPLDQNLAVLFNDKLATVAIQGPDRILQRIKASDLVVRPSNLPEEKAGLETTITLKAEFTNPMAFPEAARQTRFISILPKTVRLQYIWLWKPQYHLNDFEMLPEEQSEQ